MKPVDEWPYRWIRSRRLAAFVDTAVIAVAMLAAAAAVAVMGYGAWVAYIK